MADEATDFSRESSKFEEECLASLYRAQNTYQTEQLADSMSQVEIFDGCVWQTPRQKEKVREDQVQNGAGGYVFKVTDETIVRRFLILGSVSGAYYQNPKKLTVEDAKPICDIIREGNGSLVLRELATINSQNRNPKMSPLLFTLAICARSYVHDATGTDSPLIKAFSKYISELHKKAFALVTEVCRIPTHLFEFVGYCEEISRSTYKGSKTSTGWGRSMRTAIKNWYAEKTIETLAMFLTKYPRREGWSHRDLFRLSHPVLRKLYKPDFDTRPDRLELEQIYRFAVKGNLLPRKRKMVDEVKKEDKVKEDEVKKDEVKEDEVKEDEVKEDEVKEDEVKEDEVKEDEVKEDEVKEDEGEEDKENEYEVKEDKVKEDETKEDEVKEDEPKKIYTDEQMDNELNSRHLNLIEAYLALKHEKSEEVIAEAIKKFGLVREHLPTDCLNSKERIESICSRVTNQPELKKSKLHPMALLTARATYSAGHGDKGSLSWTPEPRIVRALEEGFYKSFVNAPSTNKRYCLALDISGSMDSPCSSSPLTCRDAAAAMSVIHLRNEEQVKCVAFCQDLTELPFTKNWDIAQINEHISKLKFGGTDCSRPMLWAAEKNLKFDVFIIYTDNDTWAGDIQPFEALKLYREQSGIRDAKLIVMGMQSTAFTIADPTDRGMLDVVGLDQSVPQTLHEFITGNI